MRRGSTRATHGFGLPGIRAEPRLASAGMDRPNDSPRPGSPITRELPLVPPSTSTGGTTQVLTPPAPPQATGPVDFVPEPPPVPDRPAAPERPAADRPAEDRPSAGEGPVPGVRSAEPPAVGPRTRRRPGLVAPALGLAAVVLLEAGLLLSATGGSFWTRVPLWSGFATLAALLALPAFLARPARTTALGHRTGLLGAGAVAGVAVFWVLVVLPVADTDRGFVLTAALACLGAGFWLAPARAN
jgi:hypothetical protein